MVTLLDTRIPQRPKFNQIELEKKINPFSKSYISAGFFPICLLLLKGHIWTLMMNPKISLNIQILIEHLT